MKNAKLLKSILIPTLGISTISTVAAISTSCSFITCPVTSVELDKTTATLIVGGTETLKATVLPENATNKSVTWSSNDTSVATVNQNGTITAVKPGNATITVTTNNGNITATCEVDVNTNPYVTITANKDSTLTLNNYDENKPDLQYSFDGANWTTYNNTLNVAKDKILYLKGNNPNGWSTSISNYSKLSITGDVFISGNVMGLLDNGAMPGGRGDITDIPCSFCFCRLFKESTGIISVSDDFLPATSLTENCYYSMFYNCTSLKSAPELPATTLTDSCYNSMFYNCTSLNWIKIGYKGNYNSKYFYAWVSGGASSGKFYYNGSDTCANFGFNSGWTKTPF